MTDTQNLPCARRAAAEEGAPLSTKIAATLALVACVGCCALPILIVAGILTGTGAALLQQSLVAGAIGLGVLAAALWWLRRRQLSKRAAAAGETGCGSATCAC